MFRCLQEISYLTSPQAMNPLPNRPLLNNSSLPLAIPNVPSFDQMAYNGRPRKVMPEVGKEFPILNGISLIPGTSSTSASSASQQSTLDRPGILSSSVVPSQQHQQAPGGITVPQVQSTQQQQPQTQPGPVPQPLTLPSQQSEASEKEKESSEPTQLTAIFRPDDEWKEKLRLSHEASEQTRLERAGQTLGQVSGAASWEQRGRDEEEETKEEEGDVDEEEANEVGEGEGGKVWKTKRTLRKSVSSLS